MLKYTVFPIVVAATATLGVAAVAQSPSELLEKGIFTEETVGDLEAAIKIYETIVADERANRPYVAQAKYRLGVCYLKKGQKEKAAKTFEKLIGEFPKQAKLIERARGQLAALGQPLPGPVVRRVRDARQGTVFGAASPDGKYLSTVDWATGDLAIREIATGNLRRLTDKGTWSESSECAMFSIFSPDSQQIAYTWYNKDGFFVDLRIIRLEDSKPRVVYRLREGAWLQPLAWSADGQYVLVYRTKKTDQIVLVSVADGSARTLKSWDHDYLPRMSFSPDGRYVAYHGVDATEHTSNTDISLLATDGSGDIPLIQHPADDRVLGFAPDGKGLLFASDRRGTWDAWLVQIVEGRPQGEARLVKTNLGRIDPLGFTHDGSFYYSVRAGLIDVYIATLDPKTGKPLTDLQPATTRFVGSNEAPAWSVDGRLLAFSSFGRFGGSERVLCILSLETGQQREFPMQGKLLDGLRGLCWSPDGKYTLVRNRSINRDQGIYRIDTQTGDVSDFVLDIPGETVHQPHCTPDGEAVFFLRRGKGAHRIVRRDLETGQESEVHRTATSIVDCPLSPDGQQLAVVTRNANREWAVQLLPAGGGEHRDLFRPESLRGLEWTSDGGRLLFLKHAGDDGPETATELWQISTAGGEPEKLELAVPGMRHLRVHPDGQRVAFTAGADMFDYEIWVMENFLPEPRSNE